jgi:hypothetical protein
MLCSWHSHIKKKIITSCQITKWMLKSGWRWIFFIFTKYFQIVKKKCFRHHLAPFCILTTGNNFFLLWLCQEHSISQNLNISSSGFTTKKSWIIADGMRHIKKINVVSRVLSELKLTYWEKNLTSFTQHIALTQNPFKVNLTILRYVLLNFVSWVTSKNNVDHLKAIPLKMWKD